MDFTSNDTTAATIGDSEERKTKRARSGPAELPSSVISVFFNEAGERAGPPIDLPVSSTAKQLQGLINSLLSNDDKVSFGLICANNLLDKLILNIALM